MILWFLFQQASAATPVLVSDPCLTIAVMNEPRTFVVAAEPRTFTVQC